jgi:ribosome maturation factor RimP
MGRNEEIAEKVRGLVEPVVTRDGFELVDVECLGVPGNRILRLYVDRPGGGISIDECAEVSYTVEGILDAEDLVDGRYSLEVSSPGLDRPLRKPADFDKYRGQKARLKTYGPFEGRRNFVGKLEGYDAQGGVVVIDVDGKTFRVPHKDIAKANLDYEFE